ncbi:MAG: metallophosphoesterase [bacterium]
MIRFLHTSDWQLGMTRHFLSEGAQERYSQARFDAIRTIGRVAKDEKCQFVLVCGDAFESNQVHRKTVARAMEALKEVSVPVFILPGNHVSGTLLHTLHCGKGTLLKIIKIVVCIVWGVW